MTRTAVLAYSGGLDTTCIISWLKEDYGYDEVVAVLVDVGQAFDVDEAIVRGQAAGADDVLLVDRREAFANEQVAKALKANALYEGRYPLVSALSRPVIAEAVAQLAQELGAEAAVHGCTGKGNDQLRFELAFRANYPGVKVIAPLRDRVWTRDEEIDYALARRIPVKQSAASPYSIDENLFGRSIECGALQDPWTGPHEDGGLTKAELQIRRALETRWRELVYAGLWCSPAREAIDAFVDATQEPAEGEVRVALRPGTAVVTGRRSEQALYAHNLASY